MTATAGLTQVAEYNATAAALADLNARYKGVVFDVATRDGMVAAVKGRAELRGYRTGLEKLRVELKAPALERSRLIDAEARRITAELSALEDPLDDLIKSEETRKERERAEAEEKEQQRVAAINDRIMAIDSAPGRWVGKPSAEIEGALECVRDIIIEGHFGEFEPRAAASKARAVATLEQLYEGAAAQEKTQAAERQRQADERAELDRLRAEGAERDRKAEADRIERERADAAARDKLEKEQRESRERIAAEEKAAQERRDKADADAKALRDKEESEARTRREAIEREQATERERIAAERREVERLQNELVGGEEMLRRFVDRFGQRAEFAGVVTAIAKHFAKPAKAAKAAA